MGRSRPRSPLGRIVHETRRQAGLDQKELADLVGSSQPRISDLEGEPEHLEQALATLAAIDEATGHDRGHTLRRAGYVVDTTDLADLIQSDPSLDASVRDHLAGLYRLMRNRAPLPADEAAAGFRERAAAADAEGPTTRQAG